MSDTFIKSYCGLVDLYQRPDDMGYMLSFDDLLVETRDYYGFDTIEGAERALGWIVPQLVADWHRLPATRPDLACRAVLENMIVLDPMVGEQDYAEQRAQVKRGLDALMVYLLHQGND